MSFSHRFGVGIGGSPEDPYEPPVCRDCTKVYCSGDCLELRQWWEKQEQAIKELEESINNQEKRSTQ